MLKRLLLENKCWQLCQSKASLWTELVDTSCANLCKKCWGLTNFIFSHILHGYFRDIQNIEDTDKIQFPRDFFAFSCLLVFSILYCMLVLLDRLLFCFQAVWVSLLCVKSAIWLTLFAFSLYTYIFFCLFVCYILCFCIFAFLYFYFCVFVFLLFIFVVFLPFLYFCVWCISCWSFSSVSVSALLCVKSDVICQQPLPLPYHCLLFILFPSLM